MGALLAPLQLGYGTLMGAEAASNLPAHHPAQLRDVKGGFPHASNSIRRDKVLISIWDKTPAIYPLAYYIYSTYIQSAISPFLWEWHLGIRRRYTARRCVLIHLPLHTSPWPQLELAWLQIRQNKGKGKSTVTWQQGATHSYQWTPLGSLGRIPCISSGKLDGIA